MLAARQADRRGRTAVDDAHDDRLATAVVEILLDGIAEHARLPEAAKDLVELGGVADTDRLVDRPAQGAADETGRGGRQPEDGLIGARRLGDRDPAVRNVAQRPALVEKCFF